MIIIYSLPNCPNCRKLKKHCQENNIEYIEKDVTSDFRAKARLIVEGLELMPVLQLKEDLFFECDDLEFLKSKVLENN
jgi:glutaredoxin